MLDTPPSLRNIKETAPAATGTVETNAPKDTLVRSNNIVSSSGSYRKRNTRSPLAVIFVPFFTIFVRRRTYT